MLANIYMNRFLKYWRLSGCGEAFCAHVVAYADDFVILSCGHAAEALAWTKVVMSKLGLTINEAKTSLKDARKERFDFLGYSFGLHYFGANGKRYQGASPSKKSIKRFKTKIGVTTAPTGCASSCPNRCLGRSSRRADSANSCYGALIKCRRNGALSAQPTIC